MSINDMGITLQSRKQIAEGLSRFLASSYMLYLKSHNYHWNVTGSDFGSLHLMFEHQYTDLAQAVDDIAERIRALDFKAPGTFREFLELSHLREDAPQKVLEAEDMVRALEEDHEKISVEARKIIDVAGKSGDEATMDLLTNRLKFHEKTAWMLRSVLSSAAKVRPATA